MVAPEALLDRYFRTRALRERKVGVKSVWNRVEQDLLAEVDELFMTTRYALNRAVGRDHEGFRFDGEAARHAEEALIKIEMILSVIPT